MEAWQISQLPEGYTTRPALYDNERCKWVVEIAHPDFEGEMFGYEDSYLVLDTINNNIKYTVVFSENFKNEFFMVSEDEISADATLNILKNFNNE